MEQMDILRLQDYAKTNREFKNGQFVAFTEQGRFLFQWLDPFFGFAKLIQPEGTKGFFTTKQLVEVFGPNQEYITLD